ncbi:1270_t:CDS:1, partial [Gigaspora rosea]
DTQLPDHFLLYKVIGNSKLKNSHQPLNVLLAEFSKIPLEKEQVSKENGT